MRRQVCVLLAAVLAAGTAHAGEDLNNRNVRWPYYPGLERVIRSFEVPYNAWYTIQAIVPKGKKFIVQIGCKMRPGATIAFLGDVRRYEPYPAYGQDNNSAGEASDYMYGKTGSQNDTYAYGEIESEPFGPQGVAEPEHRKHLGSGPRHLAVAEFGFSALAHGNNKKSLVTETVVCTTDAGAYNTHIHTTADKGVKILGEAWGPGVSPWIYDRDFDGGTVVRAGAGAGPNLGVGPHALVEVNRSKSVRFKRAAGAMFVDAVSYHSPATVDVPVPNSVLKIIGPDRQWNGISSGGGTVTGPLGVDKGNYGARRLFFAGLNPGHWRFEIQTFLAAMWWGPFVGEGNYLGLVTYDADFPPCSRTRVQWVEKDRRKVCGPGPAKMKHARTR